MESGLESISSLHNPRIKLAAALRETRQRKKHGLTIVDGAREVDRALRAQLAIQTLFLQQTWWEQQTESEPSDDALRHQIDSLSRSVSVLLLPDPLMEKISFGERVSPCLAILSVPSFDLDGFVPLSPGPLVVLDRLEKPGNLGAVARSLDAVHAGGLLLSDPQCEPWNPNAIRASQGAVFTIPIACGAGVTLREWLISQGYTVFVARLDASQDYDLVTFPKQTALVIGNEAKGVGSTWDDPRTTGIRLPMLGAMDSLNASVTASVLLYEELRQRRRTEARSGEMPL